MTESYAIPVIAAQDIFSVAELTVMYGDQLLDLKISSVAGPDLPVLQTIDYTQVFKIFDARSTQLLQAMLATAMLDICCSPGGFGASNFFGGGIFGTFRPLRYTLGEDECCKEKEEKKDKCEMHDREDCKDC